jgi:membrane fusion protein, heavy metal efflux system
MKRPAVILAVFCLAACNRVPEPVAQAGGPPEMHAPRRAAGRITFPPDSPKLAQIRTAAVGTGQVAMDEVVAPGRVAINPNRLSRVAPPVPGRVTAVAVRLGDAVTEGQPLFHVESPEAEEALSECLRSEAGQAQAKAGMAKARADLERIAELYQHGAVAKKELIQVEAELAVAKAAVDQVQAGSRQVRRRLAILGLDPCEPGQHVAVRAPISGKVLELNVVPGEYRSDTSEPLVTIADLSTVWVTAQVPESSIRWIHQGERVRIELAAFPGEVFHGRVARIADTVDPQTRAVEVQTELDNRSGRFRPEMFAKIRHSHGTRTLPVVPQSALVRSEGSAWVFVERAPGEFEQVRVETGEAIGPITPVLSGLEAGARVVVDGAILLQANGGRT